MHSMQASLPLGCAAAHAFSSAAWHLGAALGGGLVTCEQYDATCGVLQPAVVSGVTWNSTQRSQAAVDAGPLSVPQAVSRAAAQPEPPAAAMVAAMASSMRRNIVTTIF